MNNRINKDKAIQHLDIITDVKRNTPKKVIVQYNGVSVYLGGANIFASEGIAKRRIRESIFGRWGSKAEQAAAKAIIEELVNDLTIRLVRI